MKTFKLAYFKLTLFYVLIVMTISLIFSIVLYQISSQELSRGFERQSKFLRLPPNNIDANQPPIINFKELDKIREEQLGESNHRLFINLIYFNLLILMLSTLVSYFLARRTLRPIEHMMDSQNRFTADASHELRTPLTAMRTEIEVNLRDGDLSLDNAKELLKSNLEEIGKLESLSHALLKLAKLEEDQKIGNEKLLVSDIVIESFEKIESLASKKSINFSNKFDDIYITGDKQSLVEVFVILLDNAIKYSPENSLVKIQIQTYEKFAEIKIIDQGIGIKASDLPYIFNRFYRADHSRNKEKVSGYGLGLSIAKKIIEAHKGSIRVDSTPGKGSTFVVALPIK